MISSDKEKILLSRAIEHYPTGIFLSDNTGRITYVNQRLLQMMEIKDRNLLIDKDFRSIFFNGDTHLNLSTLEENEHKYISGETEIQLNGKNSILNYHLNMVKDDDGQFVGIMGEVRDITQNREMEKVFNRYYEDLEGRVDRRTEELKILYNTHKEIASILDLDHLLNKILENAHKLIINADAGLLFLKEEEGHQLKKYSCYGFDEDQCDKCVVSPNKGMIFRVVSTGEPVFIRNIREAIKSREFDPEVDGEIFQFCQLNHQNIHSILCVPIIYQKENIGCMLLFNFNPEIEFIRRDFRVLEQYSTIVGIAIKNAQMYRDLKLNLKLTMCFQSITEDSEAGLSLNNLLSNTAYYIYCALPEGIKTRVMIRKEDEVYQYGETEGSPSDIYRSPIYGEQGEVGYLQVECINMGTITEIYRKYLHSISVRLGEIITNRRLNEALKQSESQFRALFQHTNEAVIVTTLDGKILMANSTWKNLTGYTEEDLKSISMHDIFLQPIPDYEQQKYLWQSQIKIKDGSIRDMETQIATFSDKRGYYIIFSLRDITEKKLLEEKNRRNQEFLNNIFSSISDAVFTIDLNGTITSANLAACRIFQYSISDLIGQNVSMLLDENQDPFLFDELVEALIANEKGSLSNCRVVDKNNTIFEAELTITSFKNNFEEIIGLCMVFKDIREMQNLINRLASEKAFTDNILSNSIDGFCLVDPDYKVIYMNDALLSLLKYGEDEIDDLYFFNILTDYGKNEEPKLIEKLATDGYVKDHERNLITKNGDIVPVLINRVRMKNNEGEDLGFYEFIRDYSERRKMEMQLIQTTKLAAIGEMAAGIAHEINNPISSIFSYADFMKKGQDMAPELYQEFVNNILLSAERIESVVKGVLDFSRQEDGAFIQCNIVNILHTSLNFLMKMLNKKAIHIELSIQDTIWDIMGNPTQLEQVFINLLNNSKQALDRIQREKKIIRISIENESNSKGDKNVWIKVYDNGTGIPASHAEKIFDPFFTTKGRSEGTGLGLSITYGIITRHGGRITCESKENEYTEFHIRIPVIAF